MMIESRIQKCSGGCGAERQLTEKEARLWNTYLIRWWCQPCGDQVGDNALLDPILEALTRQPHLRAKLREILEMK